MKRDASGLVKCHQEARSAEANVLRHRNRWSGIAVLLGCFLVAMPSLSASEEAVPAGAWAKYKMLSTYTYRGEKPPLDTVTLRVGPREELEGRTYRWWQMECEKSAGGAFSIRVLSQRVPVLHGETGMGRVARYILKEREENPLEYVNLESGRALAPKMSFRRDLLPKPLASSRRAGPFAAQATLLGQMLTLWEWSSEGEFPSVAGVEVLKLDPGLMIGTGRNFRDTLDSRITGSEDYPYRRFTKEEYDEMIEAGINYFTVDPEQAEWIRRRPVFYEQRDLKSVSFPEILYRSNFWGAVQFVDEPACYIYGDDDAKKGAKRPSDLAQLLALRVRRTAGTSGGYSSFLLDEALRSAGFNLGFMVIVEPDIPIWETLIQTSFYQLQSGAAAGIIHEGRYRLQPFRDNFKRIGMDAGWLGEKEMLLFHYAFLRGAARCWDKDWGISIYGQADPEISPQAVTLAYDLGARYIWYWTSDHQHHLPYREQLELTRHLRAHQKANPRKNRKQLLRTGKVAIALPYGYMIDLGLGALWASNDLALDKVNEGGVPYGDAVKAAVKEAFACLRNEESFDFVVESEAVNRSGYEKVIHIRENGEVDVVQH
jgi:hypothetical protein